MRLALSDARPSGPAASGRGRASFGARSRSLRALAALGLLALTAPACTVDAVGGGGDDTGDDVPQTGEISGAIQELKTRGADVSGL